MVITGNYRNYIEQPSFGKYMMAVSCLRTTAIILAPIVAATVVAGARTWKKARMGKGIYLLLHMDNIATSISAIDLCHILCCFHLIAYRHACVLIGYIQKKSCQADELVDNSQYKHNSLQPRNFWGGDCDRQSEIVQRSAAALPCRRDFNYIW